MRYKICVVTASRSEYGLLRWIMQEIKESDFFELQTVVTGAHLSPEFGLTYKEIEKDGFLITERFDMLVSSDSNVAIAKSMGLCAISLADVFYKLKSDLLIILGDRYELLPICSTALVMRIPVAHVSGGDITEGAIDNEIRNAVTQMACLHFPGTRESADRIINMTGKSENVYVVGEPGLENFYRLKSMTRAELVKSFSLDSEKKWILFTYHPETKQTVSYNLIAMQTLLKSLLNLPELQVVATYANADVGGSEINKLLEEISNNNPSKLVVIKSLGQIKYISLLRECALVVGNSSSGIVEAPILGVPVLNVGSRQYGRYCCSNIFNCNPTKEEIESALNHIVKNNFVRFNPEYYYGDGETAGKIIDVLKKWSKN